MAFTSDYELYRDIVTSMGDRRSTYRALVKKPERKRPLGKLDVDGRIWLKWVFKKLNGSMERFDMS
jgi:hypothetical protein